jgi:hypothetical protein
MNAAGEILPEVRIHQRIFKSLSSSPMKVMQTWEKRIRRKPINGRQTSSPGVDGKYGHNKKHLRIFRSKFYQ